MARKHQMGEPVESLAEAVKRDMDKWLAKDAVRKKYPALRWIALFYYWISLIVLGIGGLGIWTMFQFQTPAKDAPDIEHRIFWFEVAIAVVVVTVCALAIRAIAEMIWLAIDVEWNTRRVANKADEPGKSA